MFGFGSDEPAYRHPDPEKKTVTPEPHKLTEYDLPGEWAKTNGFYWDEGQAWLYRKWRLVPTAWSDADDLIKNGLELQELFAAFEQARRGVVEGTGIAAKVTASNRAEIHMLQVTYQTPLEPPAGTTEAQAAFQRLSTEGFKSGHTQRVLFIGVRVKPSVVAAASRKRARRGWRGWWESFKALFASLLGEKVPDYDVYADDIDELSEIFSRHGAELMTEDERRQLESWPNNGNSMWTEVAVAADRDELIIDRGRQRLEFSSVYRFMRPELDPPFAQWVTEMNAHADGPVAISVRAFLVPPSKLQASLTKTLRRVRTSQEEEDSTGGPVHLDTEKAVDLTERLRRRVHELNEPWFEEASILMARVSQDSPRTFMDDLRSNRGIDARPLPLRQLEALDEMLPCSRVRISPRRFPLSLGMLTMAGFHSFERLGDPSGILLGFTLQDLLPVYMGLRTAAEDNRESSVLVAGNLGSGKTYFLQLVAIQSVLQGSPTILINPKPGSPLRGLAELPMLQGLVEVIHLSDLQREPGVLDPFRFAETRRMAVDIAVRQITTVITDFTRDQIRALESGMSKAADAGANCVGEALARVDDDVVRDRVWAEAQNSPLFGLSISHVPRERFAEKRGLVIIEFDRGLEIPNEDKDYSQYDLTERRAVATMRLIIRFAFESLRMWGGGVVLFDEAWVWLSNPEEVRHINELNRTARSRKVVPIYATQKLDDVLDHDMQSFLSRKIILRQNDWSQFEKACTIVGIEPTDERYRFLQNANARRPSEQYPEGRPAFALHQDLEGRVSAIMVGPFPAEVDEYISTNPKDVEKYEEDHGSGDIDHFAPTTSNDAGFAQEWGEAG